MRFEAAAGGPGLSRGRSRRSLAAVLLVALALRAWFFVGLASGDPQDDGIYYGHALALSREGPTYLDRLRVRPTDGLYNPIAQFDVRPLVTFPIAAAFLLFGPGERAAVVWPLACSLATVLLAYLLGRDTADRPTGLVAALLVAVSPLDVIVGTRVLSDAPLGATTALALWLVFASSRRPHGVGWQMAAGVAAGAGCLVNGRGFIIAAAIVGLALALAATRRLERRAPLWCAVGLAAVLGADATAYAVTTGRPFQTLAIHAGAARFKYRYEPVESFDVGPVRVHATNGTVFELTETAFGRRPTPMPLGWVFPCALAGIVYSLVTGRRRGLVLFVVALFLYFEFGPVAVGADTATPRLDYYLVFKQSRFLVVLSAAASVLTAAGVRALGARQRELAGGLVLAFAVTSVAATARASAYYRSGVADLRQAATFVLADPARPIVTDQWAAFHLDVFSGHRAANLRTFSDATTLRDLEGTCVLAGGGRGVELLAGYVESTLPPVARPFTDAGASAPLGWRVALHVPGPRWAMRLRDLRIYCPDDPARNGLSSAR